MADDKRCLQMTNVKLLIMNSHNSTLAKPKSLVNEKVTSESIYENIQYVKTIVTVAPA
jgi:hypothetical protein